MNATTIASTHTLNGRTLHFTPEAVTAARRILRGHTARTRSVSPLDRACAHNATRNAAATLREALHLPSGYTIRQMILVARSFLRAHPDIASRAHLGDIVLTPEGRMAVVYSVYEHTAHVRLFGMDPTMTEEHPRDSLIHQHGALCENNCQGSEELGHIHI